MATFINRFINDRSGATAIEYGLICALISLAIIGALSGISEQIEGLYDKIKNAGVEAAP